MSAIRPRDLLPLLDGRRRWVVAAISLSLTATLVGMAQPLLVGRVLDGAGRAGGVPTGTLVLLAAAFTAQVVLGPLGGFLLARVGEGVVLGLRTRLVRRLLRVRVPELDRHRVGDLLSRATSDPAALRQALGGGVADLVTGGIGVVVALVVMAVVDPVLLLLVAGLVLLAALAVRATLGGIRAAAHRTQDALGELTADLDRALGAIRTVRASRAEERESARVLAAADRVHRAGVRVAGLQAVAAPAVQLAVNGSFVVVLLVGGLRVVNGSASVAELVTFLLYLTYLAAPISSVVHALAALQEGAGALRRTSEVLALPVERSGGERGGDVPGAPLLELRDVRLSYGARTVLDGLSFTVPRRGVVALVGPSGAGKSTVFALVERFAEPDSGAVLLNGRDTSTVDVDWCRSRIGLVEQHAPLLHGTLLDNLRYAAQDATDDEVQRVLRLTGLHDLVRRLPDGLGTDVGDRGVRFSGGERQRIAIARALLAGPELLLLDEPTSQLDAEAERAVVAAIEQVSRECALLVIAHRFSTIRSADRVVLLEGGRAAPDGEHDRLVESSAFYRSLVGVR